MLCISSYFELYYLELDRYGTLYFKGKNQIIRAPCILESFEFPPETTIIGKYAFFECKINGTFTISKNIERAYDNIFIQCKFSRIVMEPGCKLEEISYWQWLRNLQYVFVSKNVKTFAYQAFAQDSKLETIEFEQGSLLNSIGGMAFYNTKISRFIIPPKCTSIGSNIFYLDDFITYVYIPASLTNIDIQAFACTTSIQTIEIDPNNMVYKSKFLSIMTKDESVILFIPTSSTSFTIPSTVGKFGPTMFQSCPSLTNINVESSNTNFDTNGGIVYSKGYTRALSCIGEATSVSIRYECIKIDSYCFFKCKNLKTITLNPGLTELEVYSFYGTCFQRIDIPASVLAFGSHCFYESIVEYITFNGNGPKTIKEWSFTYSSLKEVHFGKNLETLEKYTFLEAKELETVIFDPNCPLSSIEDQTFNRCKKLKSFTLPKNVIQLCDSCFSNTDSMTTFVIPSDSKLSKIIDLAFQYSAITSISFPKTLTFLGVNSFQYCQSLKSVTFAAETNLPSLGGGVFKSCTSLPTITIPLTVSSFEPSAFAFCSSLVSINVPSENQYYTCRDGIVYTINRLKLICCPGGKEAARIYNYIIVIGSNAFYGCSKLRDLTFEDGCELETIEDGTFYSCTALVRVDLPTSLRAVEQNAFAGCTNLTIITFPNCSLVNLDAELIFADCTSLMTFTFGKFCALNALGVRIFSNCRKLKTINIPANCTTIKEDAFINCESLSNLTFELHSKMSSLSETAFSGCTSLTNYTIPDSFTRITSLCFGGAPSIESVNILPNLEIESICTNAFTNFNLRFINIGEGTIVSNIEEYAFCNTSIESFHLDCEVSLSSYVFKNCSSLKNVYIKQILNSPFESTSFIYSKRLMSVESEYYTIPIGTFFGCNNLESIIINKNIVNISDYAFTDCRNLVFNIPRSVERIGNFAFKNCFNINKVPENVIYIGNSSFIRTSVPSVIRLCTHVKYIGSSAFLNTGVRIVYFCGSRDFSQFNPSFEQGTNVIVGSDYQHSMFCGSPTFHKTSNICSDIIETNFVGVDIFKKQMKNEMITHTSFLLISSCYLGLW